MKSIFITVSFEGLSGDDEHHCIIVESSEYRIDRIITVCAAIVECDHNGFIRHWFARLHKIQKLGQGDAVITGFFQRKHLVSEISNRYVRSVAFPVRRIDYAVIQQDWD